MRNPIFRAVATFVLTLGFVSALPASAQIRSAPATPQARSADWPQIGFDAGHSGYNPYETILSPSTVGGLHLRWTRSGVSFPVVAKGLLFASDASEFRLSAFDARSGALRWQGDPTPESPGAPAFDGGRVYATSYGPELYAFDAHTGTLLWSSTGPAYGFSPPTIKRGRVYVGDPGTSYSFAFDEMSGDQLWAVDSFPENTNAQPVAADGLVFLGPPFTAVNAATGKIVWTSSISGGSPTAVGGVLYTTVEYSSVDAVDAADGTIVWSTEIGGYGGLLAVANGVVYAGNSLGTVTALEAATGHNLWTATVGAFAIGGTPAVANGVVYAGSVDGQLAAIDAGTGVVLWSKKLPASVVSLIVVNGMLYATTADNAGVVAVYAFGL